LEELEVQKKDLVVFATSEALESLENEIEDERKKVDLNLVT